MSTQPAYNLQYHFDSDLRDVPDAPEEMRAHVDLMLAQYAAGGLESNEQLRILGTLGVCLRMLGDLDKAAEILLVALTLAKAEGNRNSYLANSLRLAHVYQWQRRFVEADSIFTSSIALCRNSPELHDYLDFALQHYGKSLFDQGRFYEAESMFKEALILREAKGDDALISSTRFALETTSSWLGGE